MDIEKINELLSNESFIEDCSNITSAIDFKDIALRHGVEIAAEEAEEILVQIGKLVSQKNGEVLSEDDLDEVAGGSLLLIGIMTSPLFPIAPAVIATGVGIAAVGYYLYKKKKK